jgi:hypothetical protein
VNLKIKGQGGENSQDFTIPFISIEAKENMDTFR